MVPVAGYSVRAITDRVIEARKKAGLTQVELAERLGLSKQGYHPYEKYQTAFTLEQLYQLSRILGRSIAWFLDIDCGLAPDEQEWLEIYRSLDDSGQQVALRIMRGWMAEERQGAGLSS